MRIELKDVSKIYVPDGADFHALSHLDLRFPERGLVCILGPSGCGKTTLLNIIGGLDHPTSGQVLVDGKDLFSQDSHLLDRYRNEQVGFIFQEYDLLGNLNCLDNVRVALDIRRLGREEMNARALDALRKVGLEAEARRLPKALSGGQKQRVAIARALVCDPSVILADEPTGALDSHTGEEIVSLLAEQAEKRLVVVVTHNADLAERFADLIIRLKDGKLESIEERHNKNITESMEIPVEEQQDNEERSAEKPSEDKKRFGLGFIGSLRLAIKHIKSRLGRFIAMAFSSSFGVLFLAFTLSITNGFGGYIERINRQTGTSMSYIAPAYNIASQSADWADYNQTDEYPSADEIYPYYSPQSSTYVQRNALDEHYIAFLDQLIQDGLLGDYIVNRSGDGGMRVLTQQPGSLLTGAGAGAIQVDTTAYAGMAPGTGGMYFEPTSIFHPLFGDYQSDYDVLAGRLPENENEAVLIVDKRNAVDFNTLRSLGFYNSADTQEDILDLSLNTRVKGFSFDEALGKEYRIYSLDSYYTSGGSKTVTDGDGHTRIFESFYESYLDYPGALDAERLEAYYEAVDPTITLTVVGIIRPDASLAAPAMRTGIGYVESLADTIAAVNADAEISTGYADAFSLADGGTASQLFEDIQQVLSEIDTEDNLDLTGLRSVLDADLRGWVNSNRAYQNSNDLYYYTTLSGYFSAASNFAAPLVSEELSGVSLTSIADLIPFISEMVQAYLQGDTDQAYSLLISLCALIYSYSTIESITLIPASMDRSSQLAQRLSDYNDVQPGSIYHAQSEGERVYIIDYVSTYIVDVGQAVEMMSVILLIFALISLVAAAAICASVTNMSALERTREIGILRAMGARRADIGYMFEAEALIAGLLGGLLGFALSALFTIPVNAIVNAFYPQYSIGNIALTAWWHPLAVIPLAVIISLVAALFPSLHAAKKDPVLCLREDR